MFKVTVSGSRNRTCKKPKTAISWAMYHVRDLVRIDYVDPDGRQYWWDFPALTTLSELRHRIQFDHFLRFMRRHFGEGLPQGATNG